MLFLLLLPPAGILPRGKIPRRHPSNLTHVSKNFLTWQMILTLSFCSVSLILFCREANPGASTSSTEFSNDSNDSSCISAQ